MATTTVRKGTNPVVVILIFILAILLIAGCVLAFKWLAPEQWNKFFPKSDAQLQSELDTTKSQLNATQTELGQTKAELLAEQSKHIAWGLVIGIVIAAILVILFWYFFVQARENALTVEQFRDKFIPIVRERMGFPVGVYPYHKFLHKTFERKERKKSDKDSINELMYFGEFSFYAFEDENLFIHGTHAPLDNTVTVSILNKSWKYSQQWYEYTHLDDAILQASKQEQRGQALQKTRLKDDVLEALETSKSVQQLKQNLGSPDEEATD
jgi:NADH:ubiquinone oxidoreductase subunit 5 (subunit L)/multisubunit Na+/H+ antiporter MnhA subunit